MTFIDLQNLTLDTLDDPNAGYFGLTILKQRLNLSLRELQKRLISANEEYYSSCVKTNLVSGQNTYALPSDFLQVIRLEYVTSGSGNTADTQKLMYITPNQRDLKISTSGNPVCYYFQKNNIVLVPVPTSTQELHLEYSYYVGDMVADIDVPDAPAQFHEYISVLTARDCMVKDGRSLGAIETKLADYEKLLKSIAEQRRADSAQMIVQTEESNW